MTKLPVAEAEVNRRKGQERPSLLQSLNRRHDILFNRYQTTDGEMKKQTARIGGEDTDIDAVLRLQIQADTAALR